ncbi:N-methyl-L-tryptophan oxidase [Legionella lytica]|uniref:N-methyl-L-tryptophan oxidase n=1 Tax=Legionella lytica TaxID=96232 RepID=A0ABW8D9H4_9GAMM
MKKIYDLIIIGCGGIGSSTLYNATRAGLSTLCIEQYEQGHQKGGTLGETRAFRKAYYDNPAYIPILEKAYLDWKNLDANSEMDLFIECGVLEMGLANSKMSVDAIQCCNDYQIPIELLSKEQITTRFPGFQVPDEMVGIFQPEAGFLQIDNCMNYFVNSATANGASVAYNEKVVSWKVGENNLVQVTTNKATYYSKYLIITTGSWAPELLHALDIPLQIIQKKLVWISVQPNEYSIQNGSPCFSYHLNGEVFYGFPNISGLVKVARHNGGALMQHPHDSPEFNNEADAIKQFAKQYLPKLTFSDAIKEASCLYDVTPDHQFVIDNHPDYPQIAFAAGLSGHAYKMSNVLGKILVDLASKQSTEFDISFLSLTRF